MKKSNLIAYLACTLLAFFILKSAQAQNMGEMSSEPPITQVQPLPGRVMGPIITNDGIVVPLENLDPFQDSTLDRTTLGKKIEQRNNIELNEPRIRERAVRERTNQAQIAEESAPSFTPLSPSKGTPIYEWTDKRGVKHFTNLIKSIPPKYRDQAIKSSEE
jgi:hypothetical protein